MAVRDDIELMQQHDGELAGGGPTSLSGDERLKLEALAQMGELVRTHLELEADEAEERLGAMWETIERRIEADAPVSAPVSAPADRRELEPDGLFTRLGKWLDRYRSQVLTGAACAAATAVLVISLWPPQVVTQTQVVRVPTPPTAPNGPTFASQPAVVEDLDVSEGSGMVLTIPGEEGENPTTVIWVTRDDMEGPI